MPKGGGGGGGGGKGELHSGDVGLKEYNSLSLRAALSRSGDYAEACVELSLLLQHCYEHSAKPVQTVMWDDTLTALNLLSRFDASAQRKAAAQLAQATERALPKQRRTTALAAYRQHALAGHRRSKKQDTAHDGTDEADMNCTGAAALPRDVIAVIFKFLDARTLVNASAVCRDWHELAKEDWLWTRHLQSTFPWEHVRLELRGSAETNAQLADLRQRGHAWKAFAMSCQMWPGLAPRSDRVRCTVCGHIYWRSDEDQSSTSSSVDIRLGVALRAGFKLRSGARAHTHQPRHLLAIAVVRSVMLGSLLAVRYLEDESDDSDEDERGPMRLWALPDVGSL
eukprot:jgi/Chlat1/4896/Chrsp31S04912